MPHFEDVPMLSADARIVTFEDAMVALAEEFEVDLAWVWLVLEFLLELEAEVGLVELAWVWLVLELVLELEADVALWPVLFPD